MQLDERPEDDERALAVVTHTQEWRMAQHRKDAVETCEENQEEEDITDTQNGAPIEGQVSGEEIF